jgi:hypothetical protein
VDIELVAQRPHGAQVRGLVHGHACGALHQRLDDEGGHMAAPRGEHAAQVGQRARLAARALARIGRIDDVGAHQQRVVGIAEHRHIGHGQRANGLAVVAVAQADEFALVRLAPVAPRMKAHLQRDLDGRGAVAGKEGVAQGATGQRRELFCQLDRGRMGAAGQHDVGQGFQLVRDGGADTGIRVPEQVDPPRAVGVEIAPPFQVEKPGPFTPGDGQRWRDGGAAPSGCRDARRPRGCARPRKRKRSRRSGSGEAGGHSAAGGRGDRAGTPGLAGGLAAEPAALDLPQGVAGRLN